MLSDVERLAVRAVGRRVPFQGPRRSIGSRSKHPLYGPPRLAWKSSSQQESLWSSAHLASDVTCERSLRGRTRPLYRGGASQRWAQMTDVIEGTTTSSGPVYSGSSSGNANRFDLYGFSSYVTQSVLRAANRQSERRLRLVFGLLLAVGGLVYLWRDRIKKRMTEEAAELTSRTMQHESIQKSAEMVGKSLAHEILHDATVAQAATKLTRDVLLQRETRDAALDLVLWIVERDESRQVVRSLLKTVVIDLAQDDEVVEELASMAARALKRESARNAVVDLGAKLLDDEITLDAAARLALRLLDREDARAMLGATFADAAHRALDDRDVRNHASAAAREALSDRRVQKSAGDALWNAYKYSIGLGPRRQNTPPDRSHEVDVGTTKLLDESTREQVAHSHDVDVGTNKPFDEATREQVAPDAFRQPPTLQDKSAQPHDTGPAHATVSEAQAARPTSEAATVPSSQTETSPDFCPPRAASSS